MYYVYMIKNSLDQLYIGLSENPEQRVTDHNKGLGAEFTKSGQFKIVFIETYPDLLAARSREVQLKKWRRDKKEKLIQLYQQGKETRRTNYVPN